jgi:hypothetical protein
VAVAGDDVEYSQHPDKQKREGQIVRQMFSSVNGGLQQGIYVATPSGKLLARVNAGWPDPDPKETLLKIHQAAQKYYQMPKSERLFSQVPDAAKDRLIFAKDQFSKPADTLDLRVTKRGYAYKGMTTFDERHPHYIGIDRMWFKPSEWQNFLPSNLKVGSKNEVKGAPRDRWVLHNHMQKACSAWDVDHIKAASMTTEVKKIEGNLIDLELRAKYSMKANTQWNKGAYDGNLFGKLQFDWSKKQFTKFEVVMLGWHDMGTFLDNARTGELTQWVASYSTINPNADSDDRMVPSNWMYGYGMNWCRTR